VTARSHGPESCPHCGLALDGEAHAHKGPGEPGQPLRYDLEKLAALAAQEKVYDETVKIRVTQEDIRKLVAKRRKKA
jgi:hypothetical protein